MSEAFKDQHGIKRGKTREICVWGTGINAVNFTFLYRECVKVIAYIDNYRTADCLDIEGIKILLPDEAGELIKKYFVVVATSENVYWEIKKQLDEMGLAEFSDYCFYGIYEKKIAVLYGNCHMLPIKEGLCASEGFSNQYGFYPLRLVQNISASHGEDFKSQIFEHCDLFIHQSIQRDNKYGIEYASESLLKRINEKCRVIAIPNLYGLPKFLFPQIDYDLPEKQIRNRGYFSFRDKYIERMYQEGRDCEYIENAIREGTVTDAAQILAQYEQFTDKLKMRERDWDIKIADWIIRENSEAQLFYDVNHPTNVVMRYIIKEILKIIRIEDVRENICLQGLDIYEVPVYGQIMKLFGMQWNNKYILRKYSKYTLTNQQISLMQYVTQYVKWNCLG